MIYDPLLYYVAGILSGLLIPLIIGFMSNKEKIVYRPKTWLSIKSMKYTTNIEYILYDVDTAEDIARVIADAFVSKAKDLKFSVNPGSYSVRVLVEAIFTKRSEECQDT